MRQWAYLVRLFEVYHWYGCEPPHVTERRACSSHLLVVTHPLSAAVSATCQRARGVHVLPLPATSAARWHEAFG